MAATYTLIASNTLGSDTASVTFSSIAGTYTDLVLRMSIRQTGAATQGNVFIKVNNSSSSDYGTTDLRGSGSAASSTRDTSNTYIAYTANYDTSTSNTFSSVELYIPNYAGSTNKVFSLFAVQETNATAAYMSAEAAIRTSTAAITEINLTGNSDYKSGSSFFLYGIKNS